jgi:hypothetical protein
LLLFGDYYFTRDGALGRPDAVDVYAGRHGRAGTRAAIPVDIEPPLGKVKALFE